MLVLHDGRRCGEPALAGAAVGEGPSRHRPGTVATARCPSKPPGMLQRLCPVPSLVADSRGSLLAPPPGPRLCAWRRECGISPRENSIGVKPG